MQRRAPVPAADAAGEDNEEAAEEHSASEKYSGVKVKVCRSFVQGVGAMQSAQVLHSLSRLVQHCVATLLLQTVQLV
jgi:hypothetical protein